MFNNCDANRHGKLTFAEWKQRDDSADGTLYTGRDTNRDGHVTRDEAGTSAGRRRCLQGFFKKADRDGDGLLSRSEAADREKKKGSDATCQFDFTARSRTVDGSGCLHYRHPDGGH